MVGMDVGDRAEQAPHRGAVGADPLVGIGWLVALFGVGQAVIAKTSASKRDKQSDDFKYFDEK